MSPSSHTRVPHHRTAGTKNVVLFLLLASQTTVLTSTGAPHCPGFCPPASATSKASAQLSCSYGSLGFFAKLKENTCQPCKFPGMNLLSAGLNNNAGLLQCEGRGALAKIVSPRWPIRRTTTILLSAQLSMAEPVIETTPENKEVTVKKARRRGFGSSWEEKTPQPTTTPKKITEKVQDPPRSESEEHGTRTDKEDQEVLRDAISILHPQAGTRPNGSRLRSRAAKSNYVLPSADLERKAKAARPSLYTREDLEMQSLLRKSILTKEVSRRNLASVSINPGSSQVKIRKGPTEEMGVVPLSELKRRGLISLNVSSQSVLAGDNDIIKELRVDMAVFVLEVGLQFFLFCDDLVCVSSHSPAVKTTIPNI
jgi:hypothetical protein